VITIANELQAANTVLSFWTTKVPIAAWITIFWLVIIAVNIFGVNIFGEVEVVCSTIKFGWIFVVIFSMIGKLFPSFKMARGALTIHLSHLCWRCPRPSRQARRLPLLERRAFHQRFQRFPLRHANLHLRHVR
jgi:amino acid permease